MAYIHFTQEQKEQARQADIAAMLMSRGETVKKSGSEFEWLDGGAKVTIRGNLWYHQYEQKGGDAIEFVKRFMDKTYPEAVEYLLGGSVGTIVPSSYEPKKKEPVEFEMPEKNENSRRAFAYLHFRRGIDKDVLNKTSCCFMQVTKPSAKAITQSCLALRRNMRWCERKLPRNFIVWAARKALSCRVRLYRIKV